MAVEKEKNNKRSQPHSPTHSVLTYLLLSHRTQHTHFKA